jgi:hypothetical protein
MATAHHLLVPHLAPPTLAPLGVVQVGLFRWTFSAVDTTASTYGNRLPSLSG